MSDEKTKEAETSVPDEIVVDRLEMVVAEPLALELAWSDDTLVSIRLMWSKDAGECPPALSPRARMFEQALVRYVSGKPTTWPDVRLSAEGLTDFSLAVLDTLRKDIAFGETCTYGELAERAGRPGAARAVGQIMAGNRYPLLIPCHRVIGAGGKLVGFSGCGLDMKDYLLKLEQGEAE